MHCAKFSWYWPSGSGEDDFSNLFNVFSLFRNYLSLEKGRSPSSEQIWMPFTQGCFVQSLVEIGPVVLEKKMKMWKVYRQTDTPTDGQTDRQTPDDRWSEKLTWAFSSGELKTKQNICLQTMKKTTNKQCKRLMV